jgi:purine-binding chemotaxis protein CheW
VQLATFYIGSEVFGIDILLTKEIGRLHEVTSVPEAPNFFRGLMNLRGQVVTIMDPGVFLGKTITVEQNDCRIIILKTESELEVLRKRKLIKTNIATKDPLAIVVDKIGEVIEVSPSKILPPPPNLTGVKKDLVSGVIQTEQQLIIILSMERLLNVCFEYGEDGYIE